MNFYLLFIPVFIQIMLAIGYLTKIKIDRILIISTGIVLSIIIGLRSHNAGYDTEKYIYLFNQITGFESITNGYMAWKGDYFFTLITVLLKKLTPHPSVYLILLSITSISLLLYALLKLFESEKNRFLIIILFLSTYAPFLLFGNVVRQGLATSLFYLGFSYLRKSPLSYYLILFLAILTHKSAIIFILFPLFHRKYSNKFIWKSIFSVFLMKYLILKILYKIPIIGSKLKFYQNSFVEPENIVQIATLLILVAVLLNRFIRHPLIKSNIIINLFIYTSICAMLFSDFPKISGRLILYVSPIIPYVIWKTLSVYTHEKELKILFASSILFLSYLFMLSNQVQTNLVY